MSESVATLPSSGAGRFQDLIFPGRLTAIGSALVDTFHTGRTRTENFQGTSVGLGGGVPNPAATVRLGVPCVNFNCTAVAGIMFRFYPAMGFMLATGQNSTTPGSGLANNVTRIIWSFCGSGIAPNAGSDMGLEIVPPSGFFSGRILGDVSPGWGFRLASANSLEFIVRGPNGLITLPFVVDTTTWHVLDMRIVAASSGQDATLSVLLDNVPMNLGALNSSWAAGTNLPPAALINAQLGFMPCIVCNPNPINNFWVYQLRFIQASTLMATF